MIIEQITVLFRSVENGSAASSGLGDLFTEKMSHVALSHSNFFARWFELLSEEERYSRATQHITPWLSTAKDRYMHMQ